MKPIIKISFALISLIVCFVYLGIVYLDNLYVQTSFLIIISSVLIIQQSPKQFVTSFRLLLPFILSLFVIYVIFALIGFRPVHTKQSAFAYWLNYGSTRALILYNLVFLIEVCFHIIKWKDILNLSLNIGFMKYLLLGRILYKLAFSTQDKLSLHLELIPSNQYRLHKPQKSIKFKLTHLLSLIYIVLRESEKIGELIDNRIKHCHGRNDEMV